MKNISTIFFDFDGVLCKDRFYQKLKFDHKEVLDFISTVVFGSESDIPDLWMKNIWSYKDVNIYISQNTSIDYDLLTDLFIQGIYEMELDKDLLNFADDLKKRWKNIGLITNNMDIFNEITRVHYNLDSVFPLIINSSDYWLLKHEQNWELFDIAMRKIWGFFSDTLMIDDSSKVYKVFTDKWWICYKYDNYKNFAKRFERNIY